MKFEYGPSKSSSNREKHGIDFDEAQELWSGTVVELRSRFQNEPRRLVIGKIGTKFWTAIVTERESATRIISVRRARDEERGFYEKITKDR